MKIIKHVDRKDVRLIQTRKLSDFKLSELLEELSAMQKAEELSLDDRSKITSLVAILITAKANIQVTFRLERYVDGYRTISYWVDVVPYDNIESVAASAILLPN